MTTSGDSSAAGLRFDPSAQLPAVVEPTAQAVAMAAAEIIAADAGSVDAVGEAADRLPAYVGAALRWQLVSVVEAHADRVARARHPMLAGMFGAGPVPWACWQGELVEPWPILADTAARVGRALPATTDGASWSGVVATDRSC